MLMEFQSVADATPIVADVCIVGGGAAGIAAALALGDTGCSVCLLESGGMAVEGATQALYDGTIDGGSGLPGLTASRDRCLGGSTSSWGGGCAPMLDRDYEAHDADPGSAWGIGQAEMNTYYRQARRTCMLDDAESFDSAVALAQRNDPLSIGRSRLAYIAGISRPINFGEVHRARLERSPNIRVLLHANLLEFHANDNASRVEHASVAGLDGTTASVRARHFVLACGGIENARLLLLSNGTMPTGLGNAHDQVGRHFMDHPRTRIGILAPDRGPRHDRTPGLTERTLGRISHIRFSDAVLDGGDLPNTRFHLTFREDAVPEGIEALRGFMQGVRTRHSPLRTTRDLARALRHADDCIPAIARKIAGRSVVTESHIDCEAFFEQRPNPESRVMLGNERDRLGQRKVRVDWRFADTEVQGFVAAARLFRDELDKAGIGPLVPDPWLEPHGDIRSSLAGMCHHMGTTRMDDDPRRGVVDRDCKVHGIDNLYVAGSSVFRNGRCFWPTFTIVAQALRLADHVGKVLAA